MIHWMMTNIAIVLATFVIAALLTSAVMAIITLRQ